MFCQRLYQRLLSEKKRVAAQKAHLFSHIPTGFFPLNIVVERKIRRETEGTCLDEMAQKTRTGAEYSMIMPQLNETMRDVLERVQVNMPWRILPRYEEMIFHYRINVELGFEAEPLDRVKRSEFQTVAKQLREWGCRITLHGPFWDLSPGSSDPLIRQVSRLRLQQFFDLLSIFEPVQVVCHTGFDPRHYREHGQAYLERSLVIWAPLVEQAERLEIPLLLENVWEHDPEFHKELFQRISSPYFRFCLDVGHQHSFSTTPLHVWLEVLVDFLEEIHLHDNDTSHDFHLPVGKGTVDFEFLFQFLQNRGRIPLLTLEPHKEEDFFESLEGLTRVLPSSFYRANERTKSTIGSGKIGIK
jgi:sugar phosphate isomerase/epimerase